MTFLCVVSKLLLIFRKLFFVIGISFTANHCLADSQDKNTSGSEFVSLKLWQNAKLTEKQNASKNAFKKGAYIGYSHSFTDEIGLDLAVDSYVYKNKSNDSFTWVVGFVSELFDLHYHIDEKKKNEYLEVITHYPLTQYLSITGYAGNAHDGKDEYRDYSVGLAYAINTSVKISAGFADREVKESDAENNVFLNIKGIF